jgi:hypothetical protein
MAPVVEAAAAAVVGVCRVVTSALSAAHSDFRPKFVTPWAAAVVAEEAAVELACSQEFRSLLAVTTAEAVVVAAENRLLLPQIARNFNQLRQRYGDWFEPYPALSSVFNHLGKTALYREFRTGDVTLERWDRQESTYQRLKQSLDFLFF